MVTYMTPKKNPSDLMNKPIDILLRRLNYTHIETKKINSNSHEKNMKPFAS